MLPTLFTRCTATLWYSMPLRAEGRYARGRPRMNGSGVKLQRISGGLQPPSRWTSHSAMAGKKAISTMRSRSESQERQHAAEGLLHRDVFGQRIDDEHVHADRRRDQADLDHHQGAGCRTRSCCR